MDSDTILLRRILRAVRDIHEEVMIIRNRTEKLPEHEQP